MRERKETSVFYRRAWRIGHVEKDGEDAKFRCVKVPSTQHDTLGEKLVIVKVIESHCASIDVVRILTNLQNAKQAQVPTLTLISIIGEIIWYDSFSQTLTMAIKVTWCLGTLETCIQSIMKVKHCSHGACLGPSILISYKKEYVMPCHFISGYSCPLKTNQTWRWCCRTWLNFFKTFPCTKITGGSVSAGQSGPVVTCTTRCSVSAAFPLESLTSCFQFIIFKKPALSVRLL